MKKLRQILDSLGSTPKDRLSTLAAGLVFLGGSLVTLVNAGLLPDQWLAIGTAMGTIGSMAIGILTGRDSQHLGESQR
jgi:hypothetical protein